MPRRFAQALGEVRGPVLAFCRTGTRSTTLWALSEAWHLDPEAILKAAAEAGYNLEGLRPRLEERSRTGAPVRSGNLPKTGNVVPLRPAATYDVVIVGGGAAGISTASSLLKRRPGLSIAVVEPRESHYYQPGWTLVGGGVFDRSQTERPMAQVMPRQVRWIRAAAAGFEPERNQVVLEDGERIAYRVLVAAPGIELNWDGIEGLRETLGRNGVTSNYMFEMAPYTYELVRSLRGGRALFTQPPMPIKCAGAPQKAMYLSCDHWLRAGTLKDIEVEFHTAGAVLFGVEYYVPSLMQYVEKYGAELNFGSTLKAVDGPARKAFFETKRADGIGGDGRARVRHDPRLPAAACPRLRAREPARRQGGLDRGRPGHPAASALRQRVRRRRCLLGPECEDGGGGPKAGAGGGRERRCAFSTGRLRAPCTTAMAPAR